MTTEEKAKAYDEALERAKLYHRNELAGTRQEITEYIFPELRESENERVRIALIKMISDIDGGHPFEKYGITKKDALNWFEKQKEQKPAERVEINKSLTEAVIAELSKYNGENHCKSPWAIDSTGLQYPLYFANLGATWQKEQKPAEWNEEDEKMYNSALWHIKNSCGNGGKNSGEYDVYNWLKNRVKSLRPVKQEWSGEDEFRLKEALEVLDESIRHLPIGCGYVTDVINVTKWLKSLRPQLKPSWSEEDEHNLNKLLQWDGIPLCLRGWVSGLPEKVGTRPSWKPTGEQMVALEITPKYFPQGCPTQLALISLYEQLKKLM